jgi:hypothetical protein
MTSKETRAGKLVVSDDSVAARVAAAKGSDVVPSSASEEVWRKRYARVTELASALASDVETLLAATRANGLVHRMGIDQDLQQLERVAGALEKVEEDIENDDATLAELAREEQGAKLAIETSVANWLVPETITTLTARERWYKDRIREALSKDPVLVQIADQRRQAEGRRGTLQRQRTKLQREWYIRGRRIEWRTAALLAMAKGIAVDVEV